MKKTNKTAKKNCAHPTALQIICRHTFTYFNFIFAIITVLLILAHAYTDLIAFLPILIINSCIGIVQQLRASKALAELSFLHTPTVTRRDGENRSEVSINDLKSGDIIELSSGMQIPCDLSLSEGELIVNESLVTGETTEITKKPSDGILSGSLVVAGNGIAKVELSNEDSYISSLANEACSQDLKETSEIFRSLNFFLKIFGIIILPIGLILFYQNFYIGHETFSHSITTAVAAVTGMIPEGLYMLASLSLAYSALRLSQVDVLVQDLKCIETLAQVDVLCVDKTGTITENFMEVDGVISFSTPEPPTSSQSENTTAATSENTAPAISENSDLIPAVSEEQALSLLAQYIDACEDTNDTMEALRQYRKELQVPDTETFTVLEKTPFSSSAKYSAITFQPCSETQQKAPITCYLGAPEKVLSPVKEHTVLCEQITEAAKNGLRTLLFAYGNDDRRFPGLLILLHNPLRNKAADTFAFFTDSGVSIKVISGDHPVTVSAVAARAQIPDSHCFLDASTLPDNITPFPSEEYTIYGRMLPEQKKSLIQSLQNNGHKVAMTGDGINDVLALRQADLGIGFASGTEAAATISQLVLLDSDFSKMPAIVTEGRRVIHNLESTAALFFIKNIFSLCMAVFSIIGCISYPLLPSQIALVSLFTIGIPGLFLSMDKRHKKIHTRFLPTAICMALPFFITDFAAVSGFVLLGRRMSFHDGELSTACTLLLCIIGLFALASFCRPLQRDQWKLLAAMAGGIVFCIFLMPGFFHISILSGRCILLFLLFAAISIPFGLLLQMICRFIFRRIL